MGMLPGSRIKFFSIILAVVTLILGSYWLFFPSRDSSISSDITSEMPGSTEVGAAGTMLVLENPSENIHVELAEADLLAFPQVEVVTGNEFINEEARFSGPLVRDVVSLLGENVEEAQFIAVNDYSVVIPRSDWTKYDVILALTMNEKPFSLRDKGPIWVIYPMSEHKELQDRLYNGRLIWQLDRITAQ